MDPSCSAMISALNDNHNSQVFAYQHPYIMNLMKKWSSVTSSMASVFNYTSNIIISLPQSCYLYIILYICMSPISPITRDLRNSGCQARKTSPLLPFLSSRSSSWEEEKTSVGTSLPRSWKRRFHGQIGFDGPTNPWRWTKSWKKTRGKSFSPDGFVIFVGFEQLRMGCEPVAVFFATG